ncbi:MAG: DMT family transporter [Myxococcota bacterium]
MTEPSPIDPPGPERLWGLRKGPLLMVVAGLSFTLMVSFVKVARAELSTLDVIFWRGVVSLPLIVGMASRVPWRPHRPWLLALRASLGFSAMLCYFYAAKGLAITDQTLLGKLQPIVIAALAPLLLGRSERSGAWGWVIIAMGLVGSAILIAPELQVGSLFGVAALAATVFSGLAHLCIRQLTATDKPLVIVLWFQVFISVVSGAALVATSGLHWPELHLWAPLAGVGICAVAGQMFMTYAYRADSASVVATAGYTTPIWAVCIDLVIWGVIPGWNAILGGAIVVTAGLFLIARK